MGGEERTSGQAAKISLVAVASWASLVVAWCSWVICLSGLSAVQSSCSSADLTYTGAGVASLANSLLSCSRFFSYQWFTVFFQLVLLVLVTACAFSTRVFLALRTPLLPFFSVAIVLGLQVRQGAARPSVAWAGSYGSNRASMPWCIPAKAVKQI